MTTSLRILAFAALFFSANYVHAAPMAGLEVDDVCMADALRETGFQGAIRVENPMSDEPCDVNAEMVLVAEYRITAGPCLTEALRDQGFLGQIVQTGRREDDDLKACAAPPIADETPVVQPLATFKGADGVEITTMRPVPNPEDLSTYERRRIYGRR